MANTTFTTASDEMLARGLAFDLQTQNPLWDHMFRKGNVRLGPKEVYARRKDQLETIANDVLRGRFGPSLHGFMCTPKNNGVARFVPVLTHESTAVYFACVRAVDEPCADKAVKGTYGGWTLGGKRRKMEEEAARELFVDALPASSGATETVLPPVVPEETGSVLEAALDAETESEEEELEADVSIPPSPYNKAAWVDNWQEFWKVLAATTEDTEGDHLVVSFDIANFYDSIDLDRLKSGLTAIAGDKAHALRLLFDLLKNWNRELRLYEPSSKGIPMDMIGDMSRVLANFYLVEFDEFMKEGVEATGGKYVRWADDMMFTCENREVARGLIYAASKKLHAMGLNINTAKVRVRTQSDFSFAWGFDVMDRLQQPALLEAGVFALQQRWDDDRYDRKETALKRSIMLLKNRPDLEDQRRWAYDVAMRIPEFPFRLSHGQIQGLITISGNPSDAAAALAATIMPSPFTEPKTHLLRCLEKQRLNGDQKFRDLYTDVREFMRGSDHPVLELAATYSPYEGERA